MLQLAAAAGEICLKYLDESGFCMWSPVSYTWCSEMNLIEEEWQRLKEDEIAGRMFDDEYDASDGSN